MFLLCFLVACVRSAFIDYNFDGRVNKLYVPSSYDPNKAYPLTVMLHGCTQNPTDFAAGTDMNKYAEKVGFFALYPLQTTGANPNKCWNWFLPEHQARGKGEPDLISRLTLDVAKKYKIDPNFISVSGLSAGAAMSVIMGVTYPDLYSGVGVSAGLEYKAATSTIGALQAMSSGGPNPSTQAGLAWNQMKPNYKSPMKVIVFHGTKDTTVAPVNGEQVTLCYIMAENLGGTDIPTTPSSKVDGQVPQGHKYVINKYDNRHDNQLMVSYVKVEGMGHAWSGGSTAGTYTDPKGPSMSEMIVQTFLPAGTTTSSSTTAPSTTTTSSTTGTGTSTTGTTTGPSTTTSTTGPSTTGGHTTVTLTSTMGEDGYVSAIFADGYSTQVCKVGDKGMFTSDWFRTILSFQTQGLPHGANIEHMVLKVAGQSLIGTIPEISIDMNDGPFNGSTDLTLADYAAHATISGLKTFDPQSFSITLPGEAHHRVNRTHPTAFRLVSKATASFGQNLLSIGCGQSSLEITYSLPHW